MTLAHAHNWDTVPLIKENLRFFYVTNTAKNRKLTEVLRSSALSISSSKRSPLCAIVSVD